MLNFHAQELATLDKLWQQDGVKISIVAGKRKMGKTTLLQEFAQDKPTVFFKASELTPRFNLLNLNRAIENAGFLGPSPNLPTIGETLTFIWRAAEKEKMLFVIDDFQHLIKVDQSLTAIITKLQMTYRTSNLLLVLSTRAPGYLTRDLVDKKSLLGSATKIILKPLDFFDSCKLFKTRTLELLVLIYAVFGGMPHTLEYMDEDRNIKENIIEHYLQPESSLHELAHNILRDEFPEIAKYVSVLIALAQHKLRRKEITEYIDAPTDIANHMTQLLTSDLVERFTIFRQGDGRFTAHFIKLPFLNFFFRYIPFFYNDIFQHNISHPLNEILADLRIYRDFIFKKICLEWCKRQSGTEGLPMLINSVQIAKDLNYNTANETPFDFALLSRLDTKVFCKCIWRERLVDLATLKALLKADLTDKKDAPPYYLLFANDDFKADCKRYAHDNPYVRLITLPMMFAEFGPKPY